MALAVAYPFQALYLLWFPLNWALNRASQAMLSGFEVKAGDAWRRPDQRGIARIYRRLAGPWRHAQAGARHARRHPGSRRGRGQRDHDPPQEHGDDRRRPADRTDPRAGRRHPHSRLPVWRGDPDSIVGILHGKDLFAAVHRHGRKLEGLDFVALCSAPWFVPDTTPLRKQLVAFRQRRQHLALVVDEYGDLEGLVTLEDIIEEIVGEIADERDVETVGIEAQRDGSVLVSGWITVRDLNRQFDWKLPDEEAATVAGLVIHEARRIPDVGQSLRVPRLPVRSAASSAQPDRAAQGDTPRRRSRLSWRAARRPRAGGRGAGLPGARWGARGLEIGEIALHQGRIAGSRRRLPFRRQRERRIEFGQARHGRPRLTHPVWTGPHGGAHAQAVALIRRTQKTFLEHVLRIVVAPGGIRACP